MNGYDSSATPPLPQASEVSLNGSHVQHPPRNVDDRASGASQATIDDNDETGRSPYYSPLTVAAISSLINNESPLFHVAADGDSTESTLTTTDNRTKNYELTVADRATAIISVYRDYLHEEARAQRKVDEQHSTDFTDTSSNQPPLLCREDDGNLLLLDGDLNHIRIDRSAFIQRPDESSQIILTPHDLRKEEIKLATLEKFCAENTITINAAADNAKDKKHAHKKKKKKRKRDASRKHKDSHSKSYSSISDSSSARKKHTQTAASTTAAFRLKADVALRTVSSAASDMVRKASMATRTTARAIRAKYGESSVDVENIRGGEEMANDYDFKCYDHDRYCGDGGLSPPSAGYTDEEEEYTVEDMEYGISPLGDKGLVFRPHDDSDDDESMAVSFKEICKDLGVTSDTHPNLDRYERERRRSYKYPIFRSKKFRKSICYGSAVLLIGVIAVSIASAITHGFEEARRRRSPPLPDYKGDEEWRERQKMEWEEEHGQKYTGYNNVAVTVPDATHFNAVEDVMPPPPMSKKDKTFQAVSAAYRPVWFDRSTGWKGQTYQASLDFCAKYNDYIPCPYEVYCPMEKTLLSGVMDHDGESWAAVINMSNEWVQVGTEGECDLYSEKYKKAPEWGLSGQNNEMITRHIMCCRRHPYEEGAVWDVPNEPGSEGNDFVHKPVTASSTGDGASGAVDDPAGNSNVVEDAADNSPANDNSGSESTPPAATETGAMTEWETQIQNAHHPAWFSNESGWQGTTHLDAQAFCESIRHGSGTLELCPLQAYCPNGPQNDKPLYLQMDAYEGEQWAPVESSNPNEWVMVGMLNKTPSSTCRTYLQLHHKPPVWGVDGSKVDIKKHILCCVRFNSENGENTIIGDEGLAVTDNALTDMVVGIQSNPDSNGNSASSEETPDNQEGSDIADGALTDMVIGIQSESNDSNFVDNAAAGSGTSSSSSYNGDEKINAIYATFDPLWLDSSFGWNGGSHNDAVQFCGKFTGSRGFKMELCPYAAYCPYGPSKPVIGGHMTDFESEGEQWAPVYGNQNHWILITAKGGNQATICLSHVQLYDEMPSWGLDDSNKEMKKHVMCCSPMQ